MNSVDMDEIHKNCLDFLLEWQENNKDFYFITRKINNKKRLESGRYFLGTDAYLVLSFWNSEDSKEHIYNINFGISDKGVASIELSCRDKDEDDEQFKHVRVIKDMIEEKGIYTKIYNKKENRWKYEYPKEKYYLDALKDFILNEKPRIDKYLKNHSESNIPLADEKINTECLERIKGYKEYVEERKKAKKTGTVMVKPSEYLMTFSHNELSNNLVEFLKSNGYKNVEAEKDYIDIQAISPSGERIYFELKTAPKVKKVIREAIGQLLEYNYKKGCKADKLVIVAKAEPNKKDIQYIEALRSLYNIPVYYNKYDTDKSELISY